MIKKSLRSIIIKLIKLYIFFLIIKDFDKHTLNKKIYYIIKYITYVAPKSLFILAIMADILKLPTDVIHFDLLIISYDYNISISIYNYKM